MSGGFEMQRISANPPCQRVRLDDSNDNDQRPIDVLHVLGPAGLEGTSAFNMVCQLSAGLDRSCYRIHTCFLGGTGPLAEAAREVGETTTVFDWFRGARDPLGAAQFWCGLPRLDWKLIHVHCGGRSVRWLCRWRTNAKVVAHFHGYQNELLETPKPISVSGADAVIAVSRAVASLLRHKKVHVVYPGVEDGLPSTPAILSSSGPLVLGYAGRLAPIKGLKYLIEAVAEIRETAPQIRLEIAGDGPERQILEEQCRLLRLSDTINFLGWQPDIRPFLARCDVLIQPSLSEGSSLALLEAMAASVPVIATAVGGTPELITNGVSGLLTPPKDVAALAKAILELASDVSLRRRMGAAGRTRAQQSFSVPRMVAEIGQIYARLT
jgi:glycosyltransferase involved in cell wall biosynthesis